MQEYYYSTLKETLYHQEYSNGLNVFVLPKNDFYKTYGLFATKFGSIDTNFKPLHQKEMIKVEDGIAHFLEHKMFDMKDGDVSDIFAKLGATTNAYTSSTRTAYLFSTSQNELECIETLLDFVQELYLTKESVEKEKGIISQEIKMYNDDPDWRNYFDSIKNLYHNHPIKKDIAGTIETVSNTTKEMLELCYETFYHPSNMVLFVVGNINPEEVFSIIKDNQDKKTFIAKEEIIRKKIEEPTTISQQEEILKMDVAIPKVTMGMKINDIVLDPYLKLKREMTMNIVLDILFSKSGDLYQEYSNENLIDDSFGASFTQERDYAFFQIGGDSEHPDELKSRITKFIKELKEHLISKEDFDRVKKKTMGSYINMFNSPETIANLFIRYYFEDNSAFELIDILEDITIEDVNQLLPLFDEKFVTTSIVIPSV